MRWPVRFTARAKFDLRRAAEYLADASGSEVLARRWMSSVLEACESINSFPERYPFFRSAHPWRFMPVGIYLVFFKVTEAGVMIGHIRHSARRTFRG